MTASDLYQQVVQGQEEISSLQKDNEKLVDASQKLVDLLSIDRFHPDIEEAISKLEELLR